MKQSDSLMKELFLPITAGIGLAVFAQQMLQDVKMQGETMTLSMWIAFGVMTAGSVYGFWTAWTRYQAHKQNQTARQPEPQPEPAVPEKAVPVYVPDPDAKMEDAAQALARMVTGHRKLLSQFKTELYPSAFRGYFGQMEEPLAYLRRYEADPGAIRCLAQMTLEALEADWNASKTRAPDFTDQLLISVYFVPALLYSQEPAAEEFARQFRSCWQGRYPQSVFEIGTYEEICKGFQKKFGCFITTAVCQAQGKADDCYELTQFRAFRDGWLAEQPGGKALIEEYYAVAPGIVNLIGLQSNRGRVYAWIRDSYLTPCLNAIETGKNQRCLETYRAMVEDLKAQYLQ